MVYAEDHFKHVQWSGASYIPNYLVPEREHDVCPPTSIQLLSTNKTSDDNPPAMASLRGDPLLMRGRWLFCGTEWELGRFVLGAGPRAGGKSRITSYLRCTAHAYYACVDWYGT